VEGADTVTVGNAQSFGKAGDTSGLELVRVRFESFEGKVFEEREGRTTDALAASIRPGNSSERNIGGHRNQHPQILYQEPDDDLQQAQQTTIHGDSVFILSTINESNSIQQQREQ
jgi:hypothetical protein